MVSFESFQQQQFYQQSFDPETSSVESYPINTMEYNYNTTAYNNNLAFAFVDLPTADASMDAFKFEMARTPSNTSLTRQSFEYPPALLSSSASSSDVGSPYSGHVNMVPMTESYHAFPHLFETQPTIFGDDSLQVEYASTFPDQDNKLTVPYPSLDPQMLSGSRDALFAPHQYNNQPNYPQTACSGYSNAPSPVPSQHSHSGYSGFSQPVTVENFPEYRRGTSVSSHQSVTSPRSVSGDEEGSEKGRCPHPDCGRVFKDLKAHMLTHLSERPEKCPIPTCPFHTKGFARKYDKNRHTLTHYKGTMVCPFCPGSGSSAEKSFNRADVFKRHLTSVHGVEQPSPNSRKKSTNSSNRKLSSYCQDATGKCSTCSAVFNNAQDFYEHLDDCVLRIVQQEEPSEAINARRLAEVSSDPAVQETFDRHMIKPDGDSHSYDSDEEEEEDDGDSEDDSESPHERCGKGFVKTAKRVTIGGAITKRQSGKQGMTRSKLGVSLLGKGRKKRKHYPASWGMSADKMKMRKRVLCVFDGPHRLVKDDMMLHNDFEVRLRLPNSNGYITDLDIETLKRAEAYHEATDEEKGEPWISEQDFFTDLMS